MKRGVILAAVVAAALLYVPQRAENGELSYTWVFRVTEKVDVPLLLLEFVVVGLFAAIVYAFSSVQR